MPVDPQAELEITAFDWVPDFTRGFVRDLRPRWACEEIGLSYRERLISAAERPDWYYAQQPWGQVPVIDDGGVRVFESGAILLHIGEKDARLLPRAPQGRADVISWLFAAFNSVEPMAFELSNIAIFAKDEEWAKLRRPGLEEFMRQRLDRLESALGQREWFAEHFSIADIAMATVLREIGNDGMLGEYAGLSAYLGRALARPAFQRALDAQLAGFTGSPPAGFEEGKAA